MSEISGVSRALVCPGFLCFAFWPQDEISPHALVHFIRKHRSHRTIGLSLRKGMVGSFKTAGSAERQQAGCPDVSEHTGVHVPRGRGGMIRDQADVSPSNLMTIRNETLEKVDQKLICCTHYFIHLYIIYAKLYIYNNIYFIIYNIYKTIKIYSIIYRKQDHPGNIPQSLATCLQGVPGEGDTPVYQRWP